MKLKRIWPIAVGGALGVAGAGVAVTGLVVGGSPAVVEVAAEPGDLEWRLDVKPTVMTVAYKAYGNPDAADGKYWLSKLTMTNDGGSPVRDLRVSYRIPERLEWTTPEATAELLPGQTRVTAFYPRLPRSVTNIRNLTPTQLEVKFQWHDGEKQRERIERRDFSFRGVTEIEYTSLPNSEWLTWGDMYDNSEVTAAYVTQEDEVVRQYLGKISEVKGGVPIINSEKELIAFGKSVYEFMTDTGMTYAGNGGVPEQIGDVTSTVQSVRLPRDVIRQNSGLCIELAMLWAALAEGSSAKAYLALVPGHCYPVIESNDGTLLAIESTGVGGSNLGGVMSFEQAVEAGNKQFKQLRDGQTPGILVPVRAEQLDGMRPPEFEATDLAGLAKMLDGRVEKARQATQVVSTQQPTQQPTQPQNGQPQVRPDVPPGVTPNPLGPGPVPQPVPQPGQGGGGMQFMVNNDGNLRVAYPAQLQAQPQVVAMARQVVPSLEFVAGDAAGVGYELQVYDFGQQATPQTALGELRQAMQAMGQPYQVGQPQQVAFAGVPAQFYPIAGGGNGAPTFTGGLFLIQRPGECLLGVGVSGPDAAWQAIAEAAAVQSGFLN